MKRFVAFVLLVLMVNVSVLLAQDSGTTSGPDQFSGELALAHVANHVGVGPLPMGTTNNIIAGNIIIDYLRSLGWEVTEDWHLVDFGPRSALSEAALQTLEDWQPIEVGSLLDAQLSEQLAGTNGPDVDPDFDHVIVPVRNIVASYGEGPVILIGAHYDSRLYADHDADESLHSAPMPGANDGGSGVGVLLELARVISEHYTPNNEIRLVFFDAEDNGRIEPFTDVYGGFASGYLLGSALYAANVDPEVENIQYMLLVDLVGEVDQSFPQEGYSVQFAPDIVNEIWAVAADLGYGDYFPQEVRSPITDDHVPFLQQGIPAVDIIDLDYAYWHTTEDTLDKVSAESLERVGRVLQTYLERSGALAPVSQ